jgi:hypothetical protein
MSDHEAGNEIIRGGFVECEKCGVILDGDESRKCEVDEVKAEIQFVLGDADGAFVRVERESIANLSVSDANQSIDLFTQAIESDAAKEGLVLLNVLLVSVEGTTPDALGFAAGVTL